MLGVLLIALISDNTTARFMAGPTVLPEIQDSVQIALEDKVQPLRP
jgi:hypothetical protein